MKIAINNPQNSTETHNDRAIYLLCDIGSFIAVLLAALLMLILYLPLELFRLSYHLVSLRAQQSGGRQ